VRRQNWETWAFIAIFAAVAVLSITIIALKTGAS